MGAQVAPLVPPRRDLTSATSSRPAHPAGSHFPCQCRRSDVPPQPSTVCRPSTTAAASRHQTHARPRLDPDLQPAITATRPTVEHHSRRDRDPRRHLPGPSAHPCTTAASPRPQPRRPRLPRHRPVTSAYATTRACAGHTDTPSAGTTATYVKATLPEIAQALAALTGEPHPLANN